MAHDLAQRRKMVLVFGVCPARASPRSASSSRSRTRIFSCPVCGEIVRGVGRNLGLAGADEHARRIPAAPLPRPWRARPPPAGSRPRPPATAARPRRARPRAGDRGQQPGVRTGVEQARDQRVEIGARLGLPGLRRLEVQRRQPSRSCFDAEDDRLVLVFHHVDHAAVGAHLQPLQRPPPANMECVPSLPSMLSIICLVPNGLPQRTQLNGSASWSTSSALACGVEQQPRLERDRVLRTGVHAQAALHAVALDELEHRLVAAIDQRRLRTGADAGHAQRAGSRVDLDPAVGRALLQRDFVLRRRREPRQMLDREFERGALLRRQVERRRLRHTVRAGASAQISRSSAPRSSVASQLKCVPA